MWLTCWNQRSLSFYTIYSLSSSNDVKKIATDVQLHGHSNENNFCCCMLLILFGLEMSFIKRATVMIEYKLRM